MTEKEIFDNLKTMADKDGVFALNKNSSERYYLAKFVKSNNGLDIAKYVYQKTGLIMYVKGKNDGVVILHRLRKNGFIRKEVVNGKEVERLYSEDLIADKDDMSVEAIYKTRLRRQIKEQAYMKKCSVKAYVEDNFAVQYIHKNKMYVNNFDDVEEWINTNIEGDDADSLRNVEGFMHIRAYLARNWKIKNPKIVSAFVDYIVEEHPELKITGRVTVKDKRQMIYDRLVELYPDKYIFGLKRRDTPLYETIYSYRREVPKGHNMSMKQMIEDYIGQGQLKYYTYNPFRKTMYTDKYIQNQLKEMFGEGSQESPVVVNFYKHTDLGNNNRKLLQGLRTFCKGNEIDLDEYLADYGYVRVSKANTSKVCKKPNTKGVEAPRTLRVNISKSRQNKEERVKD